jgi:hypothetical protein
MQLTRCFSRGNATMLGAGMLLATSLATASDEGIDRSTIFARKSGHTALYATQTGIAVGVVVKLRSYRRQSDWRQPTPGS